MLNQFDDTTVLEDWESANAARGIRSWPWWVWALLTPLLLIVGFLGLRYLPMWGPTSFTPELPPILYERLQRWTDRLGVRLPESETPFEHERRLGKVLPEGKPFTQRIIQTYVRYRFSRPADNASTLFQPEWRAEAGLGQTWQSLERVFWKAWLRKLYYTLLRRQANPYTLTGK